MNKNGFLLKFVNQFEDTDPNTITLITKFHELAEWDSLLTLSIIAMVDDEYDVRIKGDDIRNSDTIEDLYNVVKSRK